MRVPYTYLIISSASRSSGFMHLALAITVFSQSLLEVDLDSSPHQLGRGQFRPGFVGSGQSIDRKLPLEVLNLLLMYFPF